MAEYVSRQAFSTTHTRKKYFRVVFIHIFYFLSREYESTVSPPIFVAHCCFHLTWAADDLFRRASGYASDADTVELTRVAAVRRAMASKHMSPLQRTSFRVWERKRRGFAGGGQFFPGESETVLEYFPYSAAFQS